ncbi:MAG TPA: helix-turn-helix transcriptional regulator [Dehalococcoidia bacterium]|nr:helix-turn-helix transcriptional regulator [Dehalococcoidia bacterium]
MGPGAADISEIILLVSEKLPGLEPASPLEPEQARFRLFDSISHFLVNAARSQPLMLVLDDLHGADKPSLLLLEFLAGQLSDSNIMILGTYLNISGDRILGLLAQTMGKLDQAMAHFEDALAFCHKAGNRPELAWTCYDYAAMLIERNKAGDLAKAVDLLNESGSISSELGMSPLSARSAVLQEKAESVPVQTPEFPDGLTQREVEVIRLIAAGRTNREIAEELIISVRTVTTHVGNILNKTGAANRTEAAIYASQRDLVSPNSDGDR